MADHPLAYFITWRTYGTWLLGDERGSTTRLRNGHGTPHVEPHTKLHELAARRMADAPLILTESQRMAAHEAIAEACQFRGWALLALNVRTNHVHLVVRSSSSPEDVMRVLKARASRLLRQSGMLAHDRRIWSRHGSTRYLWEEMGVEAACYYVLEAQDDVVAEP